MRAIVIVPGHPGIPEPPSDAEERDRLNGKWLEAVYAIARHNDVAALEIPGWFQLRGGRVNPIAELPLDLIRLAVSGSNVRGFSSDIGANMIPSFNDSLLDYIGRTGAITPEQKAKAREAWSEGLRAAYKVMNFPPMVKSAGGSYSYEG